MNNSSAPVIAAIIPVYNVEPYLRRSLDSVLAQTFPDLDIILIDDGSTDRSGSICDEYAAKDSRVRVFHTPNRGLSAARNEGIRIAMDSPVGYLTFIDSDDWIEPDMCAVLFDVLTRNDADIVNGGEFLDSPDGTERFAQPDAVYDSVTAVKLLLWDKLSRNVHNKLWKKELFLRNSFPEGKNYEDLATAHKLYMCCEKVASTSYCGYHYIMRSSSITHSGTMRNYLDEFEAYRERYELIRSTPRFRGDKELLRHILGDCSAHNMFLWGQVFPHRAELTAEDRSRLREAAAFARRCYPLFGEPGWPAARRLLLPLLHVPSMPSFFLVSMFHRLNLKLSRLQANHSTFS